MYEPHCHQFYNSFEIDYFGGYWHGNLDQIKGTIQLN